MKTDFCSRFFDKERQFEMLESNPGSKIWKECVKLSNTYKL